MKDGFLSALAFHQLADPESAAAINSGVISN
jgi:hypothetical protein